MYRLLLLFLFLFCSVTAIGAESTDLGDLLQRAWQAERQGNIGVALAAYSSALALRPDDPQLNLKVAQLLDANKQETFTVYLVKALDALQNDPKSPLDLKIAICSAIMGERPREWYGDRRIIPIPYSRLSETEKKRLFATYPNSWFFPSKTDEMYFYLSAGQTDQAFQLAKVVVSSGDWQIPGKESFSTLVSDAIRRELAKSWTYEGKTTGNVFLRLAALGLYAQLQDQKTFKREFPQVLEFVNKQPGILKQLADLCSHIGWTDEADRVGGLYQDLSDTKLQRQDREAFRKLTKTGDKEQVTAKLRKLLADSPDSYETILDIDTLANIVDRGWGDLLVEFIQPGMLEEINSRDIRVKCILIYSTFYNRPRLDYWVRQLIGSNKDDAFCNSMAVMSFGSAENRVWLFEQLTNMFPDSDNARSALADAYLTAGYPNRALPILEQLIVKRDTNTDRNLMRGWIRMIWKAARDLGKLPEEQNYLWDQRENLSPSFVLDIAENYVADKNPVDAQKWLMLLYTPISGQRSSNLDKKDYNVWSTYAYDLRLRVLVMLNRKDDIKQLLSEARERYPDHQFLKRVMGLDKAVTIDMNDEIKRDSSLLGKSDVPNARSQTPLRIPCEEFIRLAYNLIITGKSTEAASIAATSLPAHKEWQDGLPLAVAMLRDGIKGVVPFLDWLKSVSPSAQFVGNDSSGYTQVIANTLRSKYPDLIHPFIVAAGLIAPETGLSNSFIALEVMNKGRQDDLSALVPVLSSRKLNRTTMASLVTRVGYGSIPAKWVVDLAASQTWSAAGLILNLYIKADTASQQDLRRLIGALTDQQDWIEANTYLIQGIGSRLSKRGLSTETESLIAIGLKHSNDYQRKDLYSVVTVSGTPPSGAAIDDPSAWVSYATACRNNKRIDEAQSAATTALQLAQTPQDRIDALSVLATVDPNAMNIIAAQFNSFDTGKRGSLLKISELIVALVQKDHKLAVKASPLLEIAMERDDDYARNHWRDVAAIELWAGRNENAVRMMLARLNENYGLSQIVSFICCTDMSADSRMVVSQALDKALKSTGVDLSYIAGAFSDSSLFTKGIEDGLTAFAGILYQQLQTSEGIVPVKLLDACVNALCNLASRSPSSPQLSAVWYQVTENAIKNAAGKPEDAATVSRWLSQRVEQMKSSGVKDTDTITRLVFLSDSLKSGGN